MNPLDVDNDLLEWKSYYKGITDEPIDFWIKRYLPSGITKEEGIGWIAVYKKSLSFSLGRFGLQDAWQALKQSGRTIDYQSIRELAFNYNYRSGKWLFFVDSGGKVDHLWSIIANQLINSDENMPCKCAKVSSYENRKHVICIFNDDCINKEQVLLSEQAIRNMGIKCRMVYKPDVYTALGIYKGNSFGIKPYILTSEFDLLSGTSIIETCYT